MNNQENKTAEAIIDEILERHNPKEEESNCYYWHGDVVKAMEEYAQLLVTQKGVDLNNKFSSIREGYKQTIDHLESQLEQKDKEIEELKANTEPKDKKDFTDRYKRIVETDWFKAAYHDRSTDFGELEQAKKENDKGLIRLERQLSASKEVIDELNKRIENQMITIGEFQKGIGKLINAPLGEVAYFGENEERKLKELILKLLN